MTAAEQGLAAKALAEQTRQHMRSAEQSAQAAEDARRQAEEILAQRGGQS